jgi:hypothetical protein
LCTIVLYPIAITSTSPTDYFKAEMVHHLLRHVSGSSKHSHLSQLFLHIQRPLLDISTLLALWLTKVSKADSNDSNSKTNLSASHIVPDDQVRYWVYTLILDCTYLITPAARAHWLPPEKRWLSEALSSPCPSVSAAIDCSMTLARPLLGCPYPHPVVSDSSWQIQPFYCHASTACF